MPKTEMPCKMGHLRFFVSLFGQASPAQGRRQRFYLWYLLPAWMASARYSCSKTMILAR